MLGIIKPSASSIAEETIPSWVADNNPNFIAFVKYYYQWLAKDGNPLDLLQNMVEYRNVQQTTPEYFNIISQEIMSFIPADSGVNANLIETKIRDFYLAKGTLPSYEFMIRLLFNDSVSLQWNSEKVFRPSSNAPTRKGSIGVYSATAWVPSLISGSTLIQTYPTPATATINVCDTIIANGSNVNALSIVPTSIIGSFVTGGVVKVLSNTINRSFTHISQYYNPIAFINGILVLSVTSEPTRLYPNLIVGQVGSNFAATISSFIGRAAVNNITQLEFQLCNVTGIFGNGQIYLITSAQVGKTYDDGDYFYGAISPSITSINFTSGGSLYDSSDYVEYSGGSGTPFSVAITDVGGGSVEAIDVVVAGSGYAVGDVVNATSLESYGSGFSAIVSNIDGIGATLAFEMQLEGVQISNGGYGYKVGDQLTLAGGITNSAFGPATLQVSAINTSQNILSNITVNNGGYGYKYNILSLLDTTTNSLVVGFSASTIVSNGAITNITNIICPTLINNTVVAIVNGIGATATALIIGGVVSVISITNRGINYVSPKIAFAYNGIAPALQASFSITLSATGQISSITILNGGRGYGTTVNISIIEAYGSSAILTPIITTSTTGPVTALTINKQGTYTSI